MKERSSPNFHSSLHKRAKLTLRDTIQTFIFALKNVISNRLQKQFLQHCTSIRWWAMVGIHFINLFNILFLTLVFQQWKQYFMEVSTNYSTTSSNVLTWYPVKRNLNANAYNAFLSNWLQSTIFLLRIIIENWYWRSLCCLVWNYAWSLRHPGVFRHSICLRTDGWLLLATCLRSLFASAKILSLIKLFK